MKTRSGEKIKLTSIEELLGVPNEEVASEIEIEKIKGFQNHPFKVLDDEKMTELVESVKEKGILTPVLVRPEGDEYEMISGHRRMHAAVLAGLTLIPAIVREMTDDDATIAMVDANIQREELLPSEKGFAFKMKMEAMKRQGKRTDLTSNQNGGKLETAEIVGNESGISPNQVRRYIRLTELIPELLDLVDAKRIQFTVAVDISYISKEIQRWVYEYIRENGPIKPKQIEILRKYIQLEPMTQRKLIQIFNESQVGAKPAVKVTLSEKKLRSYFPPFYNNEDMEKVITELLEEWKQKQEKADEENF
ncbi:MAG: ParB/RepB/Spo0J family partition protein [Clostridia bacterium]|nr:ParB/RepB/Spo0J family partition protein [Clostridia bacterium]